MSTADIGEYSDERPVQNDCEANPSYYRGEQMIYHIDDWRAKQRAQSDRRQSPWEWDNDDEAYPTAMAAWTAPRHKYTAAYDCICEYAKPCFPPFTCTAG